jgi:chromosome segregation ATPase
MSTLRLWRRTAVALVVALIAAGVVAAQSGVTNPSADQLVVEVRGLRAEIHQGVRVQLFLGRLQMQESRINGILSQLAGIRGALTAHESARAKKVADLELFDDASTRAMGSARVTADRELLELRTKVAQMQQEEQRLRTQETELLNQLTAAQRRWTDLDSSLDELERALPKAPRNP